MTEKIGHYQNEIMKKNLMKIATGCLSVAMLLGVTGCSSTVKNDTVEDAYYALYEGVKTKNDAMIKEVYLATDADYQQLEQNFAGVTLEEVEIMNTKELLNEGNYSLWAIESLHDYDIVDDNPTMELLFVQKTDTGYQFLSPNYINSLSNETIFTFAQQAQEQALQFQQTQEFQDFINRMNQYTAQHQEELNQLTTQMQEAQTKALQDSMNESQRMTDNARIQAENAANQALNNNAPVQPMQ